MQIMFLEEKSLYEFIEERIRILQIGEAWRVNLNAFVESQYNTHPENIEDLHTFLINHSVNEVEIRSLDVTSTIALLLFYDDFKALYDSKSFHNSKKIQQCYFRIFSDLLNSRNKIHHYAAAVTGKKKNDFIIDQIDATCCIARFALMCERNCKKNELWKKIVKQALGLQDMLRCEKWFILQDEMANDLSPNKDLSDIVMLADSGDISAQVLLGKIIFEGERDTFFTDREKAFYWFYKAAQKNNKELPV